MNTTLVLRNNTQVVRRFYDQMRFDITRKREIIGFVTMYCVNLSWVGSCVACLLREMISTNERYYVKLELSKWSN